MQRSVNDLEQAVVFDRAVTIPDLQEEIESLRASNAGLADDGVKIRFEIAQLRKENAELRDRCSTYLLRLKTEEQRREGWQKRALGAEALLQSLTEMEGDLCDENE